MNTPTNIARVLDDGTTQSQQYQYNAIGKPVQAIDPSGRTTYFTYATNSIDLLTVGQLAVGVTNSLARYKYNSIHLPLMAVDAAGQTNFFGYNTNGQLLALTNALKQIVLLNYSTNGYLTNIVAGTTTSFLSTNSFTYDGYGRVRTVTDPLGYTITTSYDSLDRPTNITYMDGTYEQVVYDKLDTALMRDRDGHWMAQAHDPLRHLTDVYDFIGRHMQMGWCTCGALESITDPNGNVTAWNRDLQNRVTAKIYPNLTQIRYNYETNSSRLLSVLDAKSQSTLYSYYIDNNLKSVSYSNAVVATPTVTFAYDTNYNRITSMVDGTGTNSYSYYPVSAGQLGAGMLSSVSNSFVSSFVTYNYDALGRITNRAINGVAEQLAYDALGRVITITNALGTFSNAYLGGTALITTNFAPFGKKTVFSYFSTTNDERLKEIWNQKTNNATLSKFDYVYDAIGQITNWTQQADTTATNAQVLTYDPVNQLLSDTVHSNTIAGAILKQYAYGYDAAGNRTTEQVGTGTSGAVAMSQSSYNNDNQLTSRTVSSGAMLFAGSVSKQATVSVAGNSATVNHQTTNFTAYANVASGTNTIPIVASDYNGNSATNKYQFIVTNNGVAETILYDADGNMTNVVTGTSTNSYQWDGANRLISITGSTNQSLFEYDGFGRRVQIVELSNGVSYATNKYIFGANELCEQRNSAGNVTKRFFDQGEQISGTNYYFTKDNLGSIREMVDSTGTIQVRYSYDPYGRQIIISGLMGADFGYAGMYFHNPSGLNLTLYRAYYADLGRWLSRDPLAEIAGLNLYDYVYNNPISWLDPYGACGGGASSSQATGGAGGGGGGGGNTPFLLLPINPPSPSVPITPIVQSWPLIPIIANFHGKDVEFPEDYDINNLNQINNVQTEASSPSLSGTPPTPRIPIRMPPILPPRPTPKPEYLTRAQAEAALGIGSDDDDICLFDELAIW
jgi:RHS repeat-associated protein